MDTSRELKVAYGDSSRSLFWENTLVGWNELSVKLSTTQRTNETQAEYMAMSTDEKERVKDRGGFVGGHAMLSDNPHSGIYETKTSRTLDTGGGNPGCNQGGVAVVEAYAMTTGSYMQTTKDKVPTLMARDFKDPTAVAYGIGRDAFTLGQNAQFMPSISERLQPTLTAKGPGAVQHGYTVRRLTPTECARLQGFPDWWCADLGTEDPSEEDMAFWRDVFETHRKVMGTSSKPKTDNQIRKWLKDPHSDAAEYKMWGNGLALPCVVFVLAGIVYYAQHDVK